MQSAKQYDAARQKSRAASFRAVNAMLIDSERKLIDSAGLPGSFRHMIYAPGFYTGYGVKTIPGVGEAIEQKRWQEAEEQIVRAGTYSPRKRIYLTKRLQHLGSEGNL